MIELGSNSKNAPKDKEGNPLTLLNVGTGKDISIKKLAFKIASIVEKAKSSDKSNLMGQNEKF